MILSPHNVWFVKSTSCARACHTHDEFRKSGPLSRCLRCLTIYFLVGIDDDQVLDLLVWRKYRETLFRVEKRSFSRSKKFRFNEARLINLELKRRITREWSHRESNDHNDDFRSATPQLKRLKCNFVNGTTVQLSCTT